jgi:hypothetical protein
MVYNSKKETNNPFLPKIQEKWKELMKFEGDSLIEKIVRSITSLILLCILICLIPVGIIMSIYNTFYNLQKKAYDNLISDKNQTASQFEFVSAVEFGIYALLSLPFLLLLIPYWIFAVIVTWLAKHRIIATIFIVILLIYLIYMNEINQLIGRYIFDLKQNFQ